MSMSQEDFDDVMSGGLAEPDQDPPAVPTPPEADSSKVKSAP